MITHVQRWAGLAALMAVCLIAAGAEAVTINYRSIGINPGVLYGESSGPGGATATVRVDPVRGDRTVVEIADGTLPPTIGRGDEIVIDDEELYILKRDSETRLTLQAPAKADHLGQEFAIRRAYTSIQKWVDDRRGNLVREDRLEVGVLYNDGPFTVKNHWLMACIAGSRTDADHFMWLTAAEGARHKGVAGSGVVLDGRDRTRTGILIEDDYTRVDGVELKQFGTWLLPAAVTVRNARGVVLERLIVHDFDGRRHDTYGIKAGVNSDVTVRNSIIYNGDAAGIIARRKSATVRVENCTVHGMQGRGVDEGLGRLSVVNTIAMDNARGDFAIKRGTQSYNMSSDGSAAGEKSQTFLRSGDQFVSIQKGLEDFHLLETSKAIDAGKNLSLNPTPVAKSTAFKDDLIGDPPTLDVDGTDRAGETDWDIGADEVESAPENVLYVDAAAPPGGTGRTWVSALGTIQEAITAAGTGEEIWVRQGTYRLTTMVRIDKPVAIYGGFLGNERKRESRGIAAMSVISAPVSGRSMQIIKSPDVAIGGFTFVAGASSGGIAAQAAIGFTIENCVFQDNHAPLGGAFQGQSSSGVIRNCRFSGNSANGNGGAVNLMGGSVTFTNCIFSQNGNSNASIGGGAIYVYANGVVSINNCSFYMNSTNAAGGAICSLFAPVSVINSILWSNRSISDPNAANTSGSVTVEYCDIGPDGFQPGTGNIQMDPFWTADFYLSGESPCRNSGSPVSTGLPSTDYDGNPRVTGGRVDMGAFEYQ